MSKMNTMAVPVSLHLAAHKGPRRCAIDPTFDLWASAGLEIHQQAARIFQGFLDAHKEGDGAFAVHNPVIVTQR